MSDSIEKLANRIDELESQVAFQDELLESLNTVVSRQDIEMHELKHQHGLLSERLKEIGESSPGATPQDETPPHY